MKSGDPRGVKAESGPGNCPGSLPLSTVAASVVGNVLSLSDSWIVVQSRRSSMDERTAFRRI